MLRFVACLGVLIALCNASLFCPHTKVPSDLKSFQTMRIQVKKAVGQEPMYKIARTDDIDKSFTASSSRFRLLSRTDNVECPSKGCITELSAAMPKLQSSVLYLTNIMGKLIPPGFTHVESSTRLYCAIVGGDCGANVPIYRYYKFLPNGLYHAYSTDEDIEIEGYTREPSPVCYGWQTLSSEQLRAEGIDGSGEDISAEEEEVAVVVTDEEREEAKREEFKMVREVCNDKTPPKPSSMKPLNVYINDKTGALKDHYYTTKVASEKDFQDKDSEFYGYKLDEKQESIGMVVVDEEKSKCGCLLRLSQMLDEQEGMIPRKDHKLIIDFKEPLPSGGERYKALEEEVYCVREQGACGANVALRKYFHILELDTIYTVNKTENPPLTVPSPPGVLCYIWANNKSHKKDPKKEEVSKKHKTTTAKPTTTSKTTAATTEKATSTTEKPKTTAKTTKSAPKTTVTTVKPKTKKTTVTSTPPPSTSAPSTTIKASTEKSTTTVAASSTTASPSTTVNAEASSKAS